MRLRTCFVLGLLAVLAGGVWGQAPDRAEGDGPRGMGARLPKVGSMLPDIELYDAEGQVFSTANLRGTYSVVVFGCLT